MTLPHCTGCTEPGAVTHSMETVEHIHDACNLGLEALERRAVHYANEASAARLKLTEANATIAALREALGKRYIGYGSGGERCRACDAYYPDHSVTCVLEDSAPAAAKLLAERDAGRVLYEAVKAELDPHEGLARDVYGVINEAVEAYRKVVD